MNTKKKTNTHMQSLTFLFCLWFFSPVPDRRPPPLFVQVYEKKNVSKIKIKRIKSIISCKMIGCFIISNLLSHILQVSMAFSTNQKRFVQDIKRLQCKPTFNVVYLCEWRSPLKISFKDTNPFQWN